MKKKKKLPCPLYGCIYTPYHLQCLLIQASHAWKMLFVRKTICLSSVKKISKNFLFSNKRTLQREFLSSFKIIAKIYTNWNFQFNAFDFYLLNWVVKILMWNILWIHWFKVRPTFFIYIFISSHLNFQQYQCYCKIFNINSGRQLAIIQNLKY